MRPTGSRPCGGAGWRRKLSPGSLHRSRPDAVASGDATTSGGQRGSQSCIREAAMQYLPGTELHQEGFPSTPGCSATSIENSPRSSWPRARPARRGHLPRTSHSPTNSTRRDCAPPGRVRPRISARSTPRSPPRTTPPSPPETPLDSATPATPADQRGRGSPSARGGAGRTVASVVSR
jgi:hypothetical protein